MTTTNKTFEFTVDVDSNDKGFKGLIAALKQAGQDLNVRLGPEVITFFQIIKREGPKVPDFPGPPDPGPGPGPQPMPCKLRLQIKPR